MFSILANDSDLDVVYHVHTAELFLVFNAYVHNAMASKKLAHTDSV